MISYNNAAPKAVNNVGQFGATEGSIGAYKSAAEYAADAKYWALLSQTKYTSVEDILAEVERLWAQGELLEEDIKQLKVDFETQQQVLLGLIQSTGTAIDNANSATELSKEATQAVLAQLDIISNMTIQTTLLPPGSMATGSYDNSTGVFSFGIPEGQPGRDGTDGTISDIGDVAVGVPVSDDYGFYVDKEDGGLYRANMSDIASLIPSIRSISINGGEEQTGAVSFNSVSSFNSRTGDVVSEVGDYSVEQITGAAKSGANSDITSLSGLTTALSIQQGGTGAKNADDARTNLGLGSVAIHSVVPIDKGGTGATTASGARTNLGLGLVATESIVPVTKGGTGSTSAENARLALVAAKSGVNSDITSMTNGVTFTQPVSVADAVDATNAVNLGQISSDQGASLIGTLEGVPVQNIISNINTDIIQLKLNWAIENGYSDTGFTFTTGGTLTVDDRDKVVYDPVSKTWYSYAGVLPVVVTAGFNPVGNADWKPQTDPTLREELSSTAGASMVGTSSGSSVQGELGDLRGADSLLAQTQYARRQSFKNNKGRKFSVYNGGVWTGTDATNDKLSPTDTVFYRLPQIVKLPSGTLVAFCNELHGNSTDIGATADQQCNLVMKSSSDNGVTWSSKVTIADFGATYQNGEMNCMYNHVDGKIYVFFTSCKGQTGWGYSQAGTLDPSLSAQIYYTYCDGEAFNWVTPINITSLFKTNSDSFAWTSPVRGAVLPDGTMAFVVTTLDTASPVNVTSHLVKWRGSELISKTAFLSNPDSGGEVGIHLENTGTLIAHSRAYRDVVGQQKFFRSDINHTNWTLLSTVATTDAKGDLVILSDGSENDPLYALTIANGSDDAGGNRSYYRVFFSRDLVTWAKSPVTGVHDVYVGYISSVDVGDGDSIVSVTEAGGPFGAIWFTWTSQSYLRSSTYALGANAVPEIASTDKAGLIPTGAIPNYSIFRNSTTGAFSLAVNGSEVPFKQTATTAAAWNAVTKTYTGPSSDTTVDVTGIEFILINAPGNVTLNGLTGGYIGQRVMVLSAATGGNIDLIRQSSSVSATDRIYYSLSSPFTALRVSYATKLAVTLVRTPIGWVSTDVANITI